MQIVTDFPCWFYVDGSLNMHRAINQSQGGGDAHTSNRSNSAGFWFWHASSRSQSSSEHPSLVWMEARYKAKMFY